MVKGKTILVTGGTGFIGAHLVEKLISTGGNIVVTYRTLKSQSYFITKNLDKKVTLEKMDITNKKKCVALGKKYSFDYIYHLAAQTIVATAFEDPYETLNTNIMGTVNILELARNSKTIQGVIVASSDKAYGKTKESYTEHSPLQGDHPYDVSKSSCDLIAQTYWHSYKVPVVITRFGNVYGPGDLHTDRLIPGLCEAIIKNKTFSIRSDGTYVRDYLYVKEVVNGYILLLKKINYIKGEAFNFSSNDTVSVIELMSHIEKIMNIKIPYTVINTAQNEIPYQHLDDTKVKKLGWKNNATLKTSFKLTLDWYKKLYIS